MTPIAGRAHSANPFTVDRRHALIPPDADGDFDVITVSREGKLRGLTSVRAATDASCD